MQKINSFEDPEYSDYYGCISDDGFFIAEKNRKHFTGDIAKILFVPVYLAFLLTVILFPFMLILLHFAFVKPAKRLKEAIENLLMADGTH